MTPPVLWELRVRRLLVQARGDLHRTIGAYQVLHAGGAPTGIQGYTVEAAGPGDNAREGNGLRIEAGAYPLCVNLSASYRTTGFDPDAEETSRLKPCVGVADTGARTFILIHPGWGFSAAVGCVQLVGGLLEPGEDIDYADSRRRVLELLTDLESMVGLFEPRHDAGITGGRLVIEGEP